MRHKDKKLHFRLRAVLEEKGLTIAEFAEKADLHYNTALAIANDKYKRIGLETLAEICKALDVELQELFEWK